MTNLLEFLKAISDETRLRILILLFTKELCVCEICDIIGESQPKVSRHLAKLRDTGIVEDKRQGQWIFYYLTSKNKVEADILAAIVNNIEQIQVLKRDRMRLSERVAEKKLCKREDDKMEG